MDKKCVKCSTTLPATKEYYHADKSSTDGLYRWCKRCKKDYDLNYRKEYYPRWKKEKFKTSAYQKERMLLKRYKMTIGQWHDLLDKQDNKCAICKIEMTHETGNAKATSCHVDHDHKTGKVRGLLCRSCNVGIGFLKDNTIILRNAIKYLS